MNETFDIYQLQLVSLDDKAELKKIAEYTIFDDCVKTHLDTIWHLCNASCWMDNYEALALNVIKSDDGFAIIYPEQCFDGYANSDLIIELANEYCVAKPFGWDFCKTKNDAIKSLLENFQFINVSNKESLL